MSEVIARFVRNGMPNDVARQLIRPLPVAWVELNLELACRAGEQIAVTHQFGLSLGDRCCLALAMRENVPAVTADKVWSKLQPLLSVKVKIIR